MVNQFSSTGSMEMITGNRKLVTLLIWIGTWSALILWGWVWKSLSAVDQIAIGIGILLTVSWVIRKYGRRILESLQSW